tara:strand:+ start:21001 stop:23019 length:2019 start_codon:yes stop_codon:yes gene_type:complete
MPDTPISQLPLLSSTGLAADDALPLADTSASETKKVTAKDLIQSGIQLIDANSIPSSKFSYTVQPESVDTNELADGSVTAAKLADQSSALYTTPLPATGSFVGQLAVDSANDKAFVWNGSSWEDLRGVTAVQADDSGGPIDTAAYLGQDVSQPTNNTENTLYVMSFLKNTTQPNQFPAGPVSAGGIVQYRNIAPSDLPIATDIDLGGVKSGSGLTVDSNGILSVDNTVTPSTTNHIVTYDANGLVTGGRAIIGSDLPPSTASTPGVVIPGTGLVMGSNAELDHNNSVSAGNATKVSFDAQGHITAALPLVASDIPDLSFTQITSGSIDGASSIDDRSVTEIKLSDYSTCFVQEGQPSGNYKLGQFWFTPSTSQLRVYARGSGGDLWLSVGFGALQAQNLRWGGVINANTSQIVTVTAIGEAEGLSAGDAIPAATDALSGMYFVTQVAGSNINLDYVQSQSFTEGDWLLCINQAQGYTHLDIAAGSGGGGSGSIQYLTDLLDVNIGTITLADGQSLVYDATSGQWRNTALTAADVGALAAGDNVSDLTNDAGYITSADVGDGTITIKTDGGGTVGSFTTNQAGSQDITLPPEVVPGDGTITVNESDGTQVGSFTTNQSANATLTLPAIGDGTITITQSDGTQVGTFTVNQAGNTTIALPAQSGVSLGLVVALG